MRGLNDVFPEAELFVEGERQLGRYSVTIARHNASGWSPTIPTLNALVTNRRLFLRPEVRKKYPPASIPAAYITKVSEVTLGDRNGLVIGLKTGHQIYIFISKQYSLRFIDDINAMQALPTRIRFDDKLVQQDIQRLINFINNL